MDRAIKRLKISTPGRVCLFGEHQDYLFLPVIACAVSLRISIEGERQNEAAVNLDLPDLGTKLSFPLSGTREYKHDRDYYRSSLNVLFRHGFSFQGGFKCRVQGDIPINAGTSSSSALIVSWLSFLAWMSRQEINLPPDDLAGYGYQAEVLEFGEPGGMMDHHATAYGGIIGIDFHPHIRVKKLRTDLKEFVIGDSGEPKDTKHVLAKVKNRVLGLVSELSVKHPDFSLLHASSESIERFRKDLNAMEYELLEGTVRNHSITHQARELLAERSLDHRQFGSLLNDHQRVLRDVLRISTPKIDRMLEAASKAGAYGGKINGSGGGGCMFAYGPEKSEQIAEAIRGAGGKAYIVKADVGTKVDLIEG